MARSAAIDTVRVIGIAAIVAGHTWDNHALHAVIGPWQVAVFFVLTGYLWTPRRTVSVEARKRFWTLMVPYGAWLVIIGAPLVVASQNPRLIGGMLVGVQIGRPFSAFWFVSCLFATCLVARIGERFPLIAWSIAIGGLIATFWFGPVMAHTPYSIGMVPTALFFLLVGKLLRVRTVSFATGLWALLVGGALVALGLTEGFDLKYGDVGVPVFGVVASACLSIGLIVVAEELVPLMSGALQDAMIVLSSGGLVVILTHTAVLYLTDSRGEWPLWICFVAALVVPWAVGILLARSPLKWLAGVPQSRRSLVTVR